MSRFSLHLFAKGTPPRAARDYVL